jgi:UDP-N-acetylglucosamine acyltransferase
MNEIHATCIIGEGVELGVGNKILPYTVIYGSTKIGDNNIIGPHTVIGTPGQDTRNPRYDSSQAKIEIGNNNIIREFTAIQKPCYSAITKIGNNVHLMQSVHIPHDAVLQDDVVITPMCVLAGITNILKGANIGLGVSIHQYAVIGQYSLISMGSPVIKNVKPFSIYIQNKKLRVNYYAIKKYGFDGFRNEIEAYVLNNVVPVQKELLLIINEYQNLHIKSKRGQYE